VREKVSFLAEAQPAAPPPVSHGESEPSPAPAGPEATGDNQPRKAGWWSRRFGNGE
jgi:ribonuclease E